MRTDLDLADESPSVAYQSARLHQAVDNLKAAHEIERANAVSTLVYDSMRAAVDVHANCAGLSIAGKDQHQNAVEYAHAAMTDLIDADTLAAYDELRYVRNRIIEYPPIGSFSPLDLSSAHRYRDAADTFVTAVQGWWNIGRERPSGTATT